MDDKMLKEMEKIKVTATAQELWEPAKPGETLENVWIPNRRERRKMLHAKGKKRGMRAMGKILQAAEQSAKENPDIKQDIYRALYDNLRKMTENLEEELSKKNILIIAATGDTVGPNKLHHIPLMKEIYKYSKENVEEVFVDTDHSYSNKRVLLTKTVAEYIEKICNH